MTVSSENADFITEQIKSLRAEIQERNRAVNQIVTAFIGGSFALFAFSLASSQPRFPISAECTLIPALSAPFVLHWLMSEWYSAQRIAIYIRRGELLLIGRTDPAAAPLVAAPLGWEQLMANWEAFRAPPDDDLCKRCWGHRCPPLPLWKAYWKSEKKLWTHPKNLALNMLMVLSILIAWRIASCSDVVIHFWKPVGLVIAANVILRVGYIYPEIRSVLSVCSSSTHCVRWAVLHRRLKGERNPRSSPPTATCIDR